MNEPLRNVLQRGPECPDTETLIGVMEHGERGDRAGCETHLRSCPFCQTELALYRGFEAGDIRSDERDAVDFIVRRLQRPAREASAPASFWQRFLTPAWMGGAAVAIGVILLAVALTSQRRAGQGSPGISDDRTLRNNAVVVTSPRGELAESPSAILWRPVDGSADYDVTLREIDGTVIFHKNVTTSPVLLPEDTRRLLEPGKKVLLEVDARDRAGTEIARSGTVSFHVGIATTQSH